MPQRYLVYTSSSASNDSQNFALHRNRQIMPIPRLRWQLARRLCLCTSLLVLTIIIAALSSIVFKVALPIRRAYHVEQDYQRKLLPFLFATSAYPAPTEPLMTDITNQLFSWSLSRLFPRYDALLGLNSDGTASDSVAGSNAWIYLAGTSKDLKPSPKAYRHRWKEPDCRDPAHVCEAFLRAFNDIAERRSFEHISRPRRFDSTQTPLYWADCDVSSMICHPFLGLAGVNMLVHMSVSADCDYSMLPDGSCRVTWRYIGLPMYQAPWTRQIRIPLQKGGSTVVSAFPSAGEQIRNIMAHEDSLEALNYDDPEAYPPLWNSMTTVTPQHNGPPTSDDWPIPFDMIGGLHDLVENPWGMPQWPYEAEILCYIERYTDILLVWWDEARDIVKPRTCVGVGAERKI